MFTAASLVKALDELVKIGGNSPKVCERAEDIIIGVEDDCAAEITPSLTNCASKDLIEISYWAPPLIVAPASLVKELSKS